LIFGRTHGYRIRGHWRDLLKKRKLIIAFMSEQLQQMDWRSSVNCNIWSGLVPDQMMCADPVTLR